ncbi:LysR substrate-binding domain-containing protein [Halorhodospira halophila]|uniref:Transcriptional regulator, LysR family n=1 Tax=Halorhodospira halophila (strain DSM 244 / SL1) TaxID=349124 RepID=A1WZS6_HALHL|nr:LysR substrate-binding domain-containing protein [Halorhodospira halophila]ABM63188.1 transcriptional regulator, LysR family [Halorhodospira halophila SL1]MBK1729367.1 DNA-binding transcriptional regulator OxyR [Halorhodospira halophila]
MNLRDLRYLVAVAEHRHFGRAARACYVSQPTLSTQLKKLEEYLEVQLVERNRRRVLLTPLGERLAERARSILSAVDDMVEVARAQAEPMTGDVRLGVIPTAGPYLLPHVIPDLAQSYPRLRLHLREDLTQRLLDQLRAGSLDGAILASPIAGDDLVSEPLCHEPFYLAVPRGHDLDRPEPVDAKDLQQTELMLLEEGHCLREQALELCRRNDVGEAAAFRATSLETLRQMVAAGVGVTLLPALAAAASRLGPDHAAISLRPFAEPAPSRDLALYWRVGTAREPTFRELVERMRSAAVLQDPTQTLPAA